MAAWKQILIANRYSQCNQNEISYSRSPYHFTHVSENGAAILLAWCLSQGVIWDSSFPFSFFRSNSMENLVVVTSLISSHLVFHWSRSLTLPLDDSESPHWVSIFLSCYPPIHPPATQSWGWGCWYSSIICPHPLPLPNYVQGKNHIP